MSIWSGCDFVDDPSSDAPLLIGSDTSVWEVLDDFDQGAPAKQIAQRFALPLRQVRALLTFSHRYVPELDPIDWSACIAVERVPGRCGGTPVMRGTRLAVSSVMSNLEDMTAEDFAEDFDVDLADVLTVSSFVKEALRLPMAS